MSGVYNPNVSSFPIPGPRSPVKLKVTLSRRLTWSEKETLRVDFTSTFIDGQQKFNKDGSFYLMVVAENDDDPSRGVAWELHDFLTRFFNVHIHAVHTLSPKVNV